MLSDHKPKLTEERPLTKQELKDACKNPMVQTKAKLKRQWDKQEKRYKTWNTPLKYKVLQVFQLNDADRKEVAKVMVKAITPQKAKELIFAKSMWSYRDITLTKDFDCGILQFKGLAVCLYFKRQCNEIEPVATDPTPIGALENDDELYARLDLFSKSPRELHASVREEMLLQEMELTELKYQVHSLEQQLIERESKIKLLKTELENLAQKEKLNAHRNSKQQNNIKKVTQRVTHYH